MLHVWLLPALTCDQRLPLITSDTGTGVALLAMPPLPSWPKLLSPQQDSSPEVAQLCRLPALTAKFIPPPETATGVVLLIVVPLPSWPKVLSPQQYTLPPTTGELIGKLVTPQVCWPPALTIAKLSPPETGTGV